MAAAGGVVGDEDVRGKGERQRAAADHAGTRGGRRGGARRMPRKALSAKRKEGSDRELDHSLTIFIIQSHSLNKAKAVEAAQG